MRHRIWPLLWVSAGLVAAFSVVMSIVADHAGAATCEPADVCDSHGYFTIFYVTVGVVLTGLSLATCGFSRKRSEAGPALGLLTSVLLLGFVAGRVEEMPSWLVALIWAIGGWFLIVSVAGLALLRGERPPHSAD
jgi:FtsH-binding integral membrane protein